MTGRSKGTWIPNISGLKGHSKCQVRPQDPGLHMKEQKLPFLCGVASHRNTYLFLVSLSFLLEKQKQKQANLIYKKCSSLSSSLQVFAEFSLFLSSILFLLLLLNQMKKPH